MYKWGILCMLTALVVILAIQYYMFGTYEGYTDNVIPPTGPVMAAPAAGCPMALPAIDVSGIASAVVAALRGAIPAPASGSLSAAPVIDVSGITAAVTTLPPTMPADDASPETTAAIPAASKQEMSKMIRALQHTVRSEMRKGRMEQLAGTAATAQATPSTLQGVEYGNGGSASGCPSTDSSSAANPVDMSQYVRKDSIPCWNCALDY